MAITVKASARLHFGLLDLSGDLGRIDGGAGMAIDRPAVVVRGRPGRQGHELSPVVERLCCALAERLGIDRGRVCLEILERIPEHVGLGSHTQLALAIGTVLGRLEGMSLSPYEVAAAARRGGTSGVGVHTFAAGGLVVDGGHSFGPAGEKQSALPSSACSAPVPPLLARYEVPPEWRIALVTPRTEVGLHGEHEARHFARAFPVPSEETGRMCREVLLRLMPGAARGDIGAVGESLRALQTLGFKRRELELQPEPVRALPGVMAEAGAHGAGLSSFGPTVFGLARSGPDAARVLEAARRHLEAHGVGAECWVAAPRSTGAVVSEEPEG